MRFKNDAKLNILKAILALFCATIFISFQTNNVSASIRNTINYQAKVTQRATGLNVSPDNSACVVTNSADTCDFRIRIWNVSTGGTSASGNNLMFEELFFVRVYSFDLLNLNSFFNIGAVLGSSGGMIKSMYWP
ncbi:MAG: hypothetical protein ACMG57_02385, partial [Candidatus Dojkabacteria bacterium]